MELTRCNLVGKADLFCRFRVQRYFNNRVINSSSDIGQMPFEASDVSDEEDVQRDRMVEDMQSLTIKEGKYFTEVQTEQMAGRDGQVHVAEEVQEEVIIQQKDTTVHLYGLAHVFVTNDGLPGASEIPVGATLAAGHISD
ncbi:hypothetical protein CYMTET_46725 [Cymbomonas tetramitiformis]|uniref:Uncharacterized protein n=1 Tax=Cymbomonas tetramitiformis TaxID=36881 RepID=A0AAE0BX63_9CHLO|nr:hypothetical protein CYMTET_46725 [Cymbomonas tetramitiformis]